MSRLVWACYALCVAAAVPAPWVGWPMVAIVAVAGGAVVALTALDVRRTAHHDDAAEALASTRAEAAQAREEVKRLRTEMQAALQQRPKPMGY